MGFLTNIVLGSPKKKQPELETRRIMVVNEPGPTTKQQIGSWMNEGSIPEKLTKMDEKIGSMFGRLQPQRGHKNDNQFTGTKTRTHGDPNNVNQMFDGNNVFPMKKRRKQ